MAVAPSNAAARCERSDYQNKQNNQFVCTKGERERETEMQHYTRDSVVAKELSRRD